MAPDLNLLAKISADRALASAILFAHRHPQASPPAHIECIDLWRCADEFVLIEAFREFAKTTLAEEFLVLEGCFGNFFYCLVLGETYTKACDRIAAIDKEARTNIKLQHLFGGQVLARKSTEDRCWFSSGSLLQAVGWEQELQSYKHFDRRPDLAYLDDVENLERVRDVAAVDASVRKFWFELVPALDKTRRRIRITQTRRAEDCMVTRFAGNPDFVNRAYPICVGDIDAWDAQPTWPQRYPMEWIRAERDRYERAGQLPSFLQAYMLQATNPADKPFKEEMLQAMDVSPWGWAPKFAVYDPARTQRSVRSSEGQVSDRYGKVVVSRLGAKILIHESSAQHWSPAGMIEDLFLCNAAHTPVKIGVEKNSLDDWLIYPISMRMLETGVSLPMAYLQAPQDQSKEDFILSLQPFAAAGNIVLVGGKLAHPQLTAEFTNFPQGKRDALNALAYAVRMLSGTPVYEDFGVENLGLNPELDAREALNVCCNADASGATVAAAVACIERRWQVLWDGAATGTEAVPSLFGRLRLAFPRQSFSVWIPADTYDQYLRIALLSALRAAKLPVLRAEHCALARGALSVLIRTDWKKKRMLLVDKNQAKLSLNALSCGYCVQPGAREPEKGVSRLLAESLETMLMVLSKTAVTEDGWPQGAHTAVSASGASYITANPRR